MDEELSDGESARSDESIHITRVLGLVVDEEDMRLCYRCVNSDGCDEIYDRSDLMDGSKHQKLVLDYERRHPPNWDLMCPHCDDGCEECECPDCERQCRFFKGVNYGCKVHPVV